MESRDIPTPDYDGPEHIPYARAERFLWGDDESKHVPDWYYLSNEKLHCMSFVLPEGRNFRNSENYPTIYGADEVFVVMEGTFALSNPKTGEVVRLESGDAGCFQGGTWHHGFNVGAGRVFVLEFFAPPPSQGTGTAYADDFDPLTERDWRYLPRELEGKWPFDANALDEKTLYKVDDDDLLPILKGKANPAYTELYADTEHLQVGRIALRPGQTTDVESHEGDEMVYLHDGTAFIHLPDAETDHWFEMSGGDGMYIPEGTPHEYHNAGDESVRVYFGTAPN
ncbi:MAG: cupin domain-containing protein [Haloarculaceae archaeon]